MSIRTARSILARFALCLTFAGSALAQGTVSPDEPSPAQAAIAAEDFIGVFDRVSLMEIGSQQQVDQCLEDLDAATTAEAAAALVPEQVAAEHPEVLDFIETGVAPSLGALKSLATGEQIPPVPAAGGTLVPGFPGPYGAYPSNPTNNWGMPNSPTGGCDFIWDTTPYSDFTRACRQHDLAYRWTPVPPGRRQEVENRFLSELLYDCSLRGPVTRILCAIRASLVFTATSLFGGGKYGGLLTPGYNTFGLPLTWPAPYAFCAQQSYATVFTDGYGNRVPRTKTMYFTGVVRPLSRIRFQLLDGSGNVVLQHMTHASRSNCVVHHEPEAVPAWLLPDGVYQARALYTPWETELVTEANLGTLEVFTPTGSTSCNQSTHVWVQGAPGPLTAGSIIYPTGVVRRLTSAHFTFVHQNGWPIYYHTTYPSRSNCVIHYEPEAHSTAGWVAGRYTITATYTEWETDAVVTRPAGYLDITAGGGGGGGWNGGSCKDPTTCP